MHSISTKMIIETFQEYFSISSFGRKHQASFYNVIGFAQIVQNLCNSRARWKLHTQQPEIPLVFPPKFHLNLLRCQCKSSKRFSNFRPPQLPRQSSANSYKALERSVTKVHHWELLRIRCNTLVAWQRLHVVLISRQKELYVVLEATKSDLEKRRSSLFTFTLFKL